MHSNYYYVAVQIHKMALRIKKFKHSVQHFNTSNTLGDQLKKNKNEFKHSIMRFNNA